MVDQPTKDATDASRASEPFISFLNQNLIDADLDITHPSWLDGTRFRMNGNRDALVTEGAQVLRCDLQTNWWRTAGPVIDVNGQTPNCAWSRSQGRCR